MTRDPERAEVARDLPLPRGSETGPLADALEAAGHGEAIPTATVQADRMPRVRHESPAAVLLLRTSTGQVVHTNGVARTMSAVTVPVPAAEWSVSAGLASLDGTASDALERVARGEGLEGQALFGRDGQPLWATAVPVPALDNAPDHVLVVLFELESNAALVRDRAVIAAGLSFTIGDPHAPGFPLVYVNPAFERTTGYSADEAVGANCRFLQGPDTDPAAVQRIRDGLAARDHFVVTLLNYRKDGTSFWNEVSLSPVFDGEGELTHYVGIQADVTARVLIEEEHTRHLEIEREARADAEAAQQRLSLMAEATSMLAATLDVDESLNRLTRLIVPLLADWCVVDLRTDDGPRRVAVRHRDRTRTAAVEVVQNAGAAGINEHSATWRVLHGGVPEQFEVVTDEHLFTAIPEQELAQAYVELGVGPAMVVPLRARRQVLGIVQLFRERGKIPYTADDLATASDLARRAALTIDNARLYQREHDVAEALQRSMLPTLPDVPGLDVAARYLPSSTAGQVGGDWYDLLQLPDGAIGIAVGDVMGHDIVAAAAMGQYRSVLRSYAWQGEGPAQVLTHVDELVQGLNIGQLATAFYARLADGVLTYSNAGHLPAALRRADGSVVLLRDASSLLVGVADLPRDEASVAMPPGSTLLLFTDGLVEDHERDLDIGLELLVDSLTAAPDDAEAVCDALIRDLSRTEQADDVAILAVRVL